MREKKQGIRERNKGTGGLNISEGEKEKQGKQEKEKREEGKRIRKRNTMIAFYGI